MKQIINLVLDEKAKCLIKKVVTLSLTAEFMSIDSENAFFKQISSNEIYNLIDRSQFNKRRRNLFLFSEKIRTKLASFFLDFEDYFSKLFLATLPFKRNIKTGLLKKVGKELKIKNVSCVQIRKY